MPARLSVQRLLMRLLLSLILAMGLFACGGGVEETTDETTKTSKPGQGSNWDQMNWNQGTWQ